MSLYLIGTDVVGAALSRASWDEVIGPTKVTVSPHHLASVVFSSGVSRVVVSGGTYWKPDESFQANTNNWDSTGGSPPTATVYLANGTSQKFLRVDAVSVTGGKLVRNTAASIAARSRYDGVSGLSRFSARVAGDAETAIDEVLGAAYTDAFIAAKQSVDDVLKRADSSWNMVQHAAVMPFLDVEAKIDEGFRAAVDKRDARGVDLAVAAMKHLASVARRTFIDPSTGEVKSQTKDAAARELAGAGGDLEKFKQEVGGALSWLKWLAIIAGGLFVVGVGGAWVAPIIARRFAR